MKRKISIVIPVFNEEENIARVYKEIRKVYKESKAEVIVVNDGSIDGTLSKLKLCKGITVVNFRRNFGQTAGILAGIRQSEGKIIVTMDGDGQNDPIDIPRLVAKLEDGYDVVSGWRKDRKDPISKRLISKVADKLRKYIFKDDIHDSGCTLKAYRAEALVDLDLYGEMHRFIPAILAWKGYRVGEIVVTHHERMTGASKYNLSRTMKGFIDMLNVWFWYRYSARPLHLFGGIGILLMMLGVGLLAFLAILKITSNYSLSDKVWPLAGFFAILAGLQLFVSGILADIAIKTYFAHPGRATYHVKEVLQL